MNNKKDAKIIGKIGMYMITQQFLSFWGAWTVGIARVAPS